ncbi:MAG: hypothetical protein WAZ18_02200 [Alphaproteobacteria bacterium]
MTPEVQLSMMNDLVQSPRFQAICRCTPELLKPVTLDDIKAFLETPSTIPATLMRHLRPLMSVSDEQLAMYFQTTPGHIIGLNASARVDKHNGEFGLND